MKLRPYATDSHSPSSTSPATHPTALCRAAFCFVAAVLFTAGCGPSTPPPVAKVDRPAALDGALARDGQLASVSLPGGSFTMGERVVTVPPFRMLRTEVTVAAYAQCVTEKRCDPIKSGAAGCNRLALEQYEQPRNCVTFAEASAYCAWSTMRLPTQEEWEWAARGQAAGTTFPWGNQPPADDQLCWKRTDGTCVVGSFPKSDAPGGVQDLAGNVWEWTSSAAPAAASSYVIRGGSWRDDTLSAVAATSSRTAAPGDRLPLLGFRCVR